MEKRILIAEDDPVSRHLLRVKLSQWGYEVLEAEDGQAAWEILEQENSPLLCILDWMMPGIDGIEICRRIREQENGAAFYFILLTARGNQKDIVKGLQAGADDYITKPFDSNELRARIQAGYRIVRLQSELGQRVQELETALKLVQELEGILPICSYCKKVRDDENYWEQLETYISRHSGTSFSHGICPDCYARYQRGEL